MEGFLPLFCMCKDAERLIVIFMKNMVDKSKGVNYINRVVNIEGDS